ncbi:DUF2975 domain-containing protein [Arsenicibacter rosenii]|nr:DUF2975 domain-containing protein [Arsenicibacter rosenii]
MMKSPSFVHWAFRTFNALFYIQLLLIAIFPVAIWYAWVYSATTEHPNHLSVTLGTHLHTEITPAKQRADWDTPTKWQYTLQATPHTFLTQGSGQSGYLLTFQVTSVEGLIALPGPMWLTIALHTLSMLLLLWIVYFLRRLFRDLHYDKLFGEHQTRYIRHVGKGLVWYGLLEMGIVAIQNQLAIRYLEQHGFLVKSVFAISTQLPDGLLPVICGISILALERVFTYGKQLQQEHELTI